jgi:hypothetical protein
MFRKNAHFSQTFTILSWRVLYETGSGLRQVLEFCLGKIFSFSRGAQFGEFRPGAWLQVVCGLPVTM